MASMDADPTFREKLLQRIPLFLHDPSIWVPIIVGFYVLILGLCVTGALKRQKVSIRELRRVQKMNTFFPEVSSSLSSSNLSEPEESGQGKKRTVKKRVDMKDWDNIGCR